MGGRLLTGEEVMYMKPVVSIGNQNFESIKGESCILYR